MNVRIRAGRRRDKANAGFTVVELLVYLLIAGVVLAAVYQLLVGQNRLYSKQRELQDVRSTIRAAANFLAWEFRQASASGGDIYTANTHNFTVRSLQGSGVVCGTDTATSRYGLVDLSGEFYATSDDSALVFAAAGSGPSDDSWVIGDITAASTSPSNVPFCFWGDSVSTSTEAELRIVPDSVLVDVRVGAPLRAFRRTTYGLYSEGGRWWLGRKIGNAVSYEKLTGPLSTPSDSGLVFTYYDAAGNVTADPALIRMVDIVVRGESYGKVRQSGQPLPGVEQDTLTIRVSLRG